MRWYVLLVVVLFLAITVFGEDPQADTEPAPDLSAVEKQLADLASRLDEQARQYAALAARFEEQARRHAEERMLMVRALDVSNTRLDAVIGALLGAGKEQVKSAVPQNETKPGIDKESAERPSRDRDAARSKW